MGRAYPMADQQRIFGARLMAVITKNLDSMVSNMVGEDKQIQMCGVELTLKTIHEFLSAGQLAFSNDDRKLPDIRQLVFPDRTLVRAGWLWLDPGAYLVTFNEVIEVPPDVMAIARPRSSLLRMGATMETAVWEPGYKGRSQSLLVVHNPNGIRLRRNSRLMQLIFIRLEAARIAELDDAVSGPLENIAKMLETVNEDMIFSGMAEEMR